MSDIGTNKLSRDMWTVAGDGSLRNQGVEFISSPIRFEDTDTYLNNLKEYISTVTTLHASKRCGTHIHINVRHVTIGQLLSLIALYAIMEPSIYSQYAIGREDNMFALPYCRYTNQIDAVYRDATAARKILQRRVWAMLGLSKYSALNFSRLVDLGTIELRQPYSTTHWPALLSWVDFIKRLTIAGFERNDPLDIMEWHQSVGLEGIQTELMGGTYPVDPDMQDDAYDAAVMTCGHVYTPWEELEWEIT